MEWIIAAVVGIAVAVAVVAWLNHRKRASAERPPEDVIGDSHKASSDQLKMLQNGDLVEYLGHKWFVRGRLDFDESGYRWTEHLLDDADARTWLSVEDDEGFEVAWWHAIAEGDIEQGGPGDRDVIVGGVAYRLQEQGEASFTGTGKTGTAPQGTCRYADYRSVDGRLLGFEDFGGRWEASLGETLQPWELTVFPSSERPGTL